MQELFLNSRQPTIFQRRSHALHDARSPFTSQKYTQTTQLPCANHAHIFTSVHVSALQKNTSICPERRRGALCRSGPSLHPSHVLRLRALRVLDDLEFHRLALGQRFESVTLDGREVHEHIRSTFLLDKPEALLVIEPFYCSTCHVLFTSSGMLLDRKSLLVGQK